MKKHIPDLRSALLILVIIAVFSTIFSMGWMALGFGTVQTLLNLQFITGYSPEAYTDSSFLITSWLLDLLCLAAGVLITRWLVQRKVSKRAVVYASVGALALLLIFPSWDQSVFPNYLLMAVMWAVVPAALLYVLGKKYLTKE